MALERVGAFLQEIELFGYDPSDPDASDLPELPSPEELRSQWLWRTGVRFWDEGTPLDLVDLDRVRKVALIAPTAARTLVKKGWAERKNFPAVGKEARLWVFLTDGSMSDLGLYENVGMTRDTAVLRKV